MERYCGGKRERGEGGDEQARTIIKAHGTVHPCCACNLISLCLWGIFYHLDTLYGKYHMVCVWKLLDDLGVHFLCVFDHFLYTTLASPPPPSSLLSPPHTIQMVHQVQLRAWLRSIRLLPTASPWAGPQPLSHPTVPSSSTPSQWQQWGVQS